MSKRPKHDIDYDLKRIMVGNQLAIMRALIELLPGKVGTVLGTDLYSRVQNTKDWWRYEFNEEVGFSAALGDRPPGDKP